MEREIGQSILNNKSLFHIIAVYLVISFSLFALSANLRAESKNHNSISSEIQSLLSKMTLEEKVGQMKDIFLPPFQAGVDAGAPTVMCNSSEVNGIPGDANYYLLTHVLRDRMRFRGFVVSDWGDIENLYTRFRVASTPEEAVRMAVMAGVDMSMVPMDYSFYDLLIKLVKAGKVPMWRINQAVSRILRVKFELGLFKSPYPDPRLRKSFASPSSDSTNLEAAEESITLVKNEDHLLPLSTNIKVLVSGPTADNLSTMNGGWTITWQ